MTTKTRLSLDAAVEDRDIDLHNSNITNMATCIHRIAKTRLQLDKWEEELREMAENPTALYGDRLSKLYHEVQKYTVDL